MFDKRKMKKGMTVGVTIAKHGVGLMGLMPGRVGEMARMADPFVKAVHGIVASQH